MVEFFNWLQPALFLLIGALLLLRVFRNRLSKKITVRAAVSHLHTTVSPQINRYGGPRETTRYVAEFKTEGRVLSFLVSPFTYDSLREGETGTLTYQGGRFVSFE